MFNKSITEHIKEDPFLVILTYIGLFIGAIIPIGLEVFIDLPIIDFSQNNQNLIVSLFATYFLSFVLAIIMMFFGVIIGIMIENIRKNYKS